MADDLHIPILHTFLDDDHEVMPRAVPADEAFAWTLSTYPNLDWEDLEDAIADAISDSMDMDWSSRDGARAVVAMMKKLGARS